MTAPTDRPTPIGSVLLLALHRCADGPSGATVNLDRVECCDLCDALAERDALRAEVEVAREHVRTLREALETITKHAEETYPHFEDVRGQRDIAAARAVLASTDPEVKP